MALLAFAVLFVVAADAAPPAAAFRRSRFLADFQFQPPTYFDCVKKPPSVCLEPGSPGKTCCKGPGPVGACTDLASSLLHCGSCNRTCKVGQVCCSGKCSDLLSDKKNCGGCSKECSKKCQYGMCDYAG
ncbi:hypothetical protein BRADI_2g08690v3 [Brachypodium distachyon]|uniref:4Fe-4S ferredoxin-type domain-containing protein n=2 Tax=Brachypodium distachyon TaxID=15368 RepID=A0A2K2D7J3_BRADI|nr:hypothetical protein BRADI_2g08690v3 [Brachypodium distachyon]